jgi:hypothetical protein
MRRRGTSRIAAMEGERRQRIVEAPADVDAAVAPWLWALEDRRRRTMGVLEGVSDADVDRPGVDGTTIGTLLYHVALIESSYLYEDMLDQPFPEVDTYFPHPVRDAAGRLQVVAGETLAEHVRRLEVIRAMLREHVGRMTADDLRSVRALADT